MAFWTIFDSGSQHTKNIWAQSHHSHYQLWPSIVSIHKTRPWVYRSIAEMFDKYRAIGVTLQYWPIFSISLHTGHIKVNYFLMVLHTCNIYVGYFWQAYIYVTIKLRDFYLLYWCNVQVNFCVQICIHVKFGFRYNEEISFLFECSSKF